MRFLTIFILLICFLDAKEKDFYYSFIDSNGKQISQVTKNTIITTLNDLEEIKLIALDGKLLEAIKKLIEIKEKNKVSVLNSDILILYGELMLKTNSKKQISQASSELENAINSSVIYQEDLLRAYLTLIDLKLNVNKVEDARYYAQTVIDTFDDEEAKARGKISLAKIFKYQKDYKKASKTLFEVLSNTKDKHIASIVANELFDIYLLDGKKEEAIELMRQLLIASPSFYSNDSILANQRVDLFLKLDMIPFAIDVLKDLIQTSKKDEIQDEAKFKLANIYMKLYDKTDNYLNLAKKLYKDIIDNHPKSPHLSDAEMFYDEIKLRQRTILPNVIADKYQQNDDMQKKALLQELINYNKDKKFEDAVKVEEVYRDIPKNILKRFGFENIDELLDISYLGLVNDYLQKQECSKLSAVLKALKIEVFTNLLHDDKLKDELIKCIREAPSLENYTQLKDILKDSQDLDIYLVLEAMALDLEEINDALYFSSKIEKSKDKEVLKDEFLYKYQVLKIYNDSVKLDKFFKDSIENSYLIEANIKNPIIIDFYYDLYLYLNKIKNDALAKEDLKTLYDKQNEFKAFVYSPYVESELARISKRDGNLEESVKYLIEATTNTRNIKPEDEVKLYYDIFSLYDTLKNEEQKAKYLQKCKDVQIENNFYKNMCIGMSL